MALTFLKDIFAHAMMEAGHHLMNNQSTNYGFDPKTNMVVDKSRETLFQLNKYSELILKEIKKIDKDSPESKALISALKVIFEGFVSVASDINLWSTEQNNRLLDELSNLINDQEFIQLCNFLPIVGRNKKTGRYQKNNKKRQLWFSLSAMLLLCDEYVVFKKTHIPKASRYLNPKYIGNKVGGGIKSLWKNKGDIGKGLLVGLGGMVLGGATKSDLFTGLGEGYLAKTALFLKRKHDVNLKTQQTILKTRSDLRNLHFDKLTEDDFDLFSRLAGGGSVKAKRNTKAIIGDNPGGKEKFNIIRGSHLLKGKTNGPVLLNMKVGDKLSASPLSGKGLTKVNYSDFSKFGGGTPQQDELIAQSTTDNKIVTAINKNSVILNKILSTETQYFKDQISRQDDLANKNLGFDKGIFGSLEKGNLQIPKIKAPESQSRSILNTMLGVGGANTLGGIATGYLIPKILPKLKDIYFGGNEPFNPEVLPTKSPGLMGGAKNIGKWGFNKLGGKVPIVGGLIAGGLNYASGAGKYASIGSGVGTMMGGMAGSLLTPFIGPFGMVVGSVAGEYFGKRIGRIFDDQNTEQKNLNEIDEKGRTGFWDNLLSWKMPFPKSVGADQQKVNEAVLENTRKVNAKRISEGKEPLDFDLITGDTSLPRNMRNKNPGNIKMSSDGLDADKEKYNDPNLSVDKDGFLKFSTVEKGKEAHIALLRKNYNNYTIDKALHKWSSNFNGDPRSYGDEIVPQYKGKKISDLDDTEILVLQKAMQKREGWKNIDKSARDLSIPVPKTPTIDQAIMEVSTINKFDQLNKIDNERNTKIEKEQLANAISMLGNSINIVAPSSNNNDSKIVNITSAPPYLCYDYSILTSRGI